MSGVEARSNDFWRRGARSLVQFLVGGGLVLIVDTTMVSIPTEWRPWVVILAGAATTLVHNLAEDLGVVPAVLKSKASSGANPVPGGPGNP